MTFILAGNTEHLESLVRDYTTEGWRLEQPTSRTLAVLTKGESGMIVIEAKY